MFQHFPQNYDWVFFIFIFLKKSIGNGAIWLGQEVAKQRYWHLECSLIKHEFHKVNMNRHFSPYFPKMTWIFFTFHENVNDTDFIESRFAWRKSIKVHLNSNNNNNNTQKKSRITFWHRVSGLFTAVYFKYWATWNAVLGLFSSSLISQMFVYY